MRISVDTKHISITEPDLITSGSVNDVKLHINLSNDYDGLIIRAYVDRQFLPVVNNTCYISNMTPGQHVLGVYGYKINDEGYELLYSPTPVFFKVVKGSYNKSIAESVVPQPDELEKFYALIKPKLDILKTDGSGNYFLSDDGTYKFVQGGGGGTVNAITMNGEILENVDGVVDIPVEQVLVPAKANDNPVSGKAVAGALSLTSMAFSIALEDKADKDDTYNKTEVDNKIQDISMAKSPNVVITGDLNVNNGQLSGFTSNDYCQFPYQVDLRNKEFEILFHCKTDILGRNQSIMGSHFGLNFAIHYTEGRNLFAIGLSWAGEEWDVVKEGTHDIQAGVSYLVSISWKTAENNHKYYTVKYSLDDGETWTTDISIQSGISLSTQTIYIGVNYAKQQPFGGVIDLNQAKLYINDQLEWQGMDDLGVATRMAKDASNVDESGKERITGIVGERLVKNDTILSEETTWSSKQISDHVDQEIANFDIVKIVQELPEAGLPNRTYFVPITGAEDNNLYEEYMWVPVAEGSEEYHWELIGNKTIDIDLSQYVKFTDIASRYTPGVLKTSIDYGFGITGDGTLYPSPPNIQLVKAGSSSLRPLTPSVQHNSTFYGLAKAAGNTDQSTSSNPVGTYTDDAKDKINKMFDSERKTKIVNETGTLVTIRLDNGIEHRCGELVELTIFTVGDEDLNTELYTSVMFKSGETPTNYADDSTILYLKNSEDVKDGTFTPAANKLYSMSFHWNGYFMECIVLGWNLSDVDPTALMEDDIYESMDGELYE